MVPRNLLLRLRIRYTHTQDTILRNQKFGKQVSPSRMHIQTIDGNSLYLSSSPIIDFPFNMKSMDGKFDSRTMMYLTHLQIHALKQSLRHILVGIANPNLFYYNNGVLCIDEQLANSKKQALPIRGMIIEMEYCIVKDIIGNNEYSSYEGIRIINRQLQTIAELTVDELDSFVNLLDSIHIADISLIATKLGLDLIKMPPDMINAMMIPRQQIINT